MIGKLKGKIDSINQDHFIIDVNGVGYFVFCSYKTLSQLTVSEYAEILIETHVREDHIHLYGFYNVDEKVAFNILQSVKGVGTRMALSILSHLTPSEIQTALNTEDKTVFNNISGVGKKLSERIITELKDKIISNNPAYINAKTNNQNNIQSNSLAQDAISALVNLGIGKADAYNRVNNLLLQSENISINDLIRMALKN